ncbi:MAG: tRNA lysidine(34) synthetase [bacterium]
MELKSRLLNPSLSAISKVTKHFNFLNKSSGVVVGVSGGPDSLTLLFLLSEYNKKFQQNWEIYACHINPEFPDWNIDFIQEFCRNLKIPCKIINTRINARLKTLEKKCFFCARERRRRLLEYAESLNIFQVALAHHLEDVVETFILNIIYNGEISTFVPKQSVIHGRFSFIRPLYYLDKKNILMIARALQIPEEINKCPYYQISKRQSIRNFLNNVSAEYPDVYKGIFNGIRNIKTPYLPMY